MAATPQRSGRPTQFHGVPFDERAFDSHGNRLPWALEWADDHPNARHQRRQPEEKGAFGRSARRKESTRSTRTATASKRENPMLDGFDAALKYDSDRMPTQATSTSASANTSAASAAAGGGAGGDTGSGVAGSGAGVSASAPKPVAKEPAQLVLYGYAPDTQWSAVAFYEGVSGGMICEDYDREPPAEQQRRRFFHSPVAHVAGGAAAEAVQRRPLSKAELALSRNYAGGRCWIKVTLDSREAAERAAFHSPHLLNGHWVYAAPWAGALPSGIPDAPIPAESKHDSSLSNPPLSPSSRQRPSTLGASSSSSYSTFLQHRRTPSAASKTLPRSYSATTTGTSFTPDEPSASGALTTTTTAEEDSPNSSSTASSSTAIGPPSSPLALYSADSELRQRHPSDVFSAGVDASNNSSVTDATAPTTPIKQQQIAKSSANFRYFPDTPKTKIRPASEALLPQPSLTERLVQRLLAALGIGPNGWIAVQDPIGSETPIAVRTDGGAGAPSFDREHGSIYWRICFAIDSWLGTDLCGIRD